jgi:hypothetical protein
MFKKIVSLLFLLFVTGSSNYIRKDSRMIYDSTGGTGTEGELDTYEYILDDNI